MIPQMFTLKNGAISLVPHLQRDNSRKKTQAGGGEFWERTSFKLSSLRESHLFGLQWFVSSPCRSCTMARLWRWMATPWRSWLVTSSQTQITLLPSQTEGAVQGHCSTGSSSRPHLMSSRANPFLHTNISIMDAFPSLFPKCTPLCQSGIFSPLLRFGFVHWPLAVYCQRKNSHWCTPR